MPFLHTLDGLDLLPLQTLVTIIWYAPDELESTVSHLALAGGLTEDQRTSLPLIHLKQRYPEAAGVIEALPWIQDGIAPPPLDEDGNPAGVDSEAELLMDMMEWQLRGYRDHFTTLLGRPWFEDGLDRREHLIVYKMMSEITSEDRQASSQILNMPFLETIGKGDLFIVDILYAAAFRDELRSLLARSALQGGIVDGQVAVVALEYLDLRDSGAAMTLKALSWIDDGIASSEIDPVLALQRLAVESSSVFDAVVGKSWLSDGVSTDELNVIYDFIYIGDKDQSLAVSIAGMPFLGGFAASDAAAMSWLKFFSDQHRRSYLNQVLSHSTLSGGIADDEASLVAALLQGANAGPAQRQALLSTLLDPAQVVVEERAVTLSHAGEVVLAVVRTTDSPSNIMDLLESAVESHEEFMAVSFPVNYVSLLVADVGRTRALAGGFIAINAESYSDVADVIAHEAAHIYWPFAPRWMQEGGAEFLEWIAENKGPPQWTFNIGVDSCLSARNLSELEQQTPGIISERSICHYRMGFVLFYDLYNALGDVEFRRGFGELFLRLNADTSDFRSSEERYRTLDSDPSEPECTGPERSLCFLRAGFVNSASDPTVGAEASQIINEWYYGPPDPDQ